MYVLIEGAEYPRSVLENLIHTSSFIEEVRNSAKIRFVGYYRNKSGAVTFILPKVFLRKDGETIFGIDPLTLVDFLKSSLDSSLRVAINQVAVNFYLSLKKYFQQRAEVNDYSVLLLDPDHRNAGLEHTFIDLLLLFTKFYNQRGTFYRHTYRSVKRNSARRVNWSKTVNRRLPIIVDGDTPLFLRVNTKKRIFDSEDELLRIFYSILNYFNEKYFTAFQIPKVVDIYKGQRFQLLFEVGYRKLKSIRTQYFRDVDVEMHTLCVLFFSYVKKSNIHSSTSEYLLSRNYNMVFEFMIDNLFRYENVDQDETLQRLKKNRDGKLIDHIYTDTSIVDVQHDIFYIADSKYYSEGANPNSLSIYKQLTYAKNIIQFNIDFVNRSSEFLLNCRYLDRVTKGYSITPNFMIFGKVESHDDYSPWLIEYGSPIFSSHFPLRAFDRDTLFIHSYAINFNFVIRNFVNGNKYQMISFQRVQRKLFREKIIEFFNDPENCGFTFYMHRSTSLDEIKMFVENNYYEIWGKVFVNSEQRLLLAVHKDDLYQVDEDEFERLMFKKRRT